MGAGFLPGLSCDSVLCALGHPSANRLALSASALSPNSRSGTAHEAISKLSQCRNFNRLEMLGHQHRYARRGSALARWHSYSHPRRQKLSQQKGSLCLRDSIRICRCRHSGTKLFSRAVGRGSRESTGHSSPDHSHDERCSLGCSYRLRFHSIPSRTHYLPDTDAYDVPSPWRCQHVLHSRTGPCGSVITPPAPHSADHQLAKYARPCWGRGAQIRAAAITLRIDPRHNPGGGLPQITAVVIRRNGDVFEPTSSLPLDAEEKMGSRSRNDAPRFRAKHASPMCTSTARRRPAQFSPRPSAGNPALGSRDLGATLYVFASAWRRREAFVAVAMALNSTRHCSPTFCLLWAMVGLP